MKCGHCGRTFSGEGNNKAVLCICGWWNCLKCGYFWKPRVARPKKCPRCATWIIPMPNESRGAEANAEF